MRVILLLQLLNHALDEIRGDNQIEDSDNVVGDLEALPRGLEDFRNSE